MNILLCFFLVHTYKSFFRVYTLVYSCWIIEDMCVQLLSGNAKLFLQNRGIIYTLTGSVWKLLCIVFFPSLLWMIFRFYQSGGSFTVIASCYRFSSTSQYIMLLYMHFCLKTPYFVYIVYSLALDSAISTITLAWMKLI